MQELYDFLIDDYIILLFLITWIVTMRRYRIYIDTPLKYFPIFLMFTFLSELLGYLVWRFDGLQFFADDAYSNHNVIVYNVYALLSFQFYYYIFWNVLRLEKHKKWVIHGVFISISAFFISLFYQNPFHISLYYADVFSSLVILFCIGLYIKEKKTEKAKYTFKYNLMFWTSLGVAIFYLIFPFVYYLLHELPTLASKYKAFNILMIAAFIMHGSFITGAILGRKNAFR